MTTAEAEIIANEYELRMYESAQRMYAPELRMLEANLGAHSLLSLVSSLVTLVRHSLHQSRDLVILLISLGLNFLDVSS